MGTGARPQPQGRERIVGIAAVRAALDRADGGLRCVVLPAAAPAEEAEALAERAARAGVAVHRVAARRYERLRGSEDAPILALRGPDARRGIDAVMAGAAPVWLLARPAYPGNVGFAIRTAEVSGAEGIYVDCDFDHAKRREALRASMRADRYMAVGWLASDAVLAAARRAGRRVIAIEDVGRRAPWQVDLCSPALLVVGAEAEGVPQALLDAADEIVRLPMAGFIASYNLQAAVAAVALERFRQLAARTP